MTSKKTDKITFEKVACQACLENGVKTFHHYMPDHLETHHQMTVEDYLAKYGADSVLGSNDLWENFDKKFGDKPRKNTTRFKNILKVGAISIPQQEGDVFYKFNRPPHYQYPTAGPAATAVERVARAFKYKRSLYIYGPAGAGKSACIRAFCHDLNLESSHYPMRDGLDTELYIGKEAVVIDEKSQQNKTEFVKGKLLLDLEGRVGADGVRRGVVILMDDIDRAPAEYHEILRHCLEDNARNIFVPELNLNIELHPDTLIVATANSAGRGDSTGYYTSVQEMDESILDRFQRAVQFHFMDSSQETEILKKKFPEIFKAGGEEPFELAVKVGEIIRGQIQNESIFASFSHRRIVQWFQSLEELVQENKGIYTHKLLKESTQDWLDWYNKETQDMVINRTLQTVLGT